MSVAGESSYSASDMRFKTSLLKEPKHSDLVSCVGWNNVDEVFSCGDDHKLIGWNLLTSESVKVADFPDDFFPTDMHWMPKGQIGTKKPASDIFLLTTTDGKFHFVNRNGRIEKSVEAHNGAVLAGRWSHDGSGLATAGEDGQVKIWSRNGMLRSTLAQVSNPVYSLVWAPDSSQLLYTLGRALVIKPLAPNSKPIQWKAHDGLILKVAWNSSNNLILSGGEDCRYKMWDNYGRQLYASAVHDFPITSLSWSPDGELFAVGSFNTLRLCDKIGWSYCLEKPNTGSIFSLAWSTDGTQVAGACGNGHVIFAHVIEKRLEWKYYEATVSGRKMITLWNVTNEAKEKLDFRDRIIKVTMGFGHLIVTTATQCYVYSTKNWNTPIIFDLKEGNVTLVKQANRHFLLVESGQVSVYNYEGKLICHPRWAGMRPELLNNAAVSICSDTLAVRDQADEKNVHLFDATTGKIFNDGKPYVHQLEVLEIALDQVGPPNERMLAVVDKNRDLILVTVRRFGSSTKAMKLGAMVSSLCWNDEHNMLAAIQESQLTVWYYPSVIFVDRNLAGKTILEKDASDLGKGPVVTNFFGNHVSIRRADGSLINIPVSPFPAVLHDYVAMSQWDDALRLCRSAKDEALWACLAGMAIHARDLSTAEVAYAAINEADKVFYLQHVQGLGSMELKAAEVALLGGSVPDAEAALMQGGMVFRAIMLHIHLYNWDRALDLAIKHKTHVDTVLAHRTRYLEKMDRKETNEKFLNYKGKVEIDWKKINSKIKKEFQKEVVEPETPSARESTYEILMRPTTSQRKVASPPPKPIEPPVMQRPPSIVERPATAEIKRPAIEPDEEEEENFFAM